MDAAANVQWAKREYDFDAIELFRRRELLRDKELQMRKLRHEIRELRVDVPTFASQAATSKRVLVDAMNTAGIAKRYRSEYLRDYMDEI